MGVLNEPCLQMSNLIMKDCRENRAEERKRANVCQRPAVYQAWDILLPLIILLDTVIPILQVQNEV